MDENTTKDLLLKRPGVFADLTGMVFGKLKVISRSEAVFSKTNSSVRWLCECECGRRKKIRPDHLRSGATQSCGCLSHVSGQKNKGWTGYEEFPGHYFCHIRARAKTFKREFNLTAKFLWELYLEQNRRCALSGLEIEFFPQKKGRSTASLDRIFSSNGYVKGNVQWVHRDINLMKNVFRPEIFHWYCTLVAEHKNKPYEAVSLPS